MTEHRFPCTAEPPELIGLSEPPFGHVHACIHDAADDPRRLVEHECECGMKWRNRPLQWQIYSNIPPGGQYGYIPVEGFWSRLFGRRQP